MRNYRKKVLNGTTQYAALYKQQINPIYWISNFVIRYYAEKMMLIEDGQVLPYHFHTYKMEDILNRGGGTLCIKCYWATEDNKLDEQRPVEISFDAQKCTFVPGEVIRIPVGSGVTLPPHMYHSIWAENGKVMSWEVSKVNDDHTDNTYLEGCLRFSEIEEDEPMRWCLCNEYAKVRK